MSKMMLQVVPCRHRSAYLRLASTYKFWLEMAAACAAVAALGDESVPRINLAR
jgi:hypothetical protein